MHGAREDLAAAVFKIKRVMSRLLRCLQAGGARSLAEEGQC